MPSAKRPSTFGQQFVGVRIRPFLQKEARTDAKAAVAVAGSHIAVISPENGEMRPFLMDAVFDSTGISEEMYSSTTALFDEVKPLLLDGGLFAGRSCSCFLMGARLTGKTHTLLGEEEDPGVLPWIMHDTFDMIRETSGGPDGSRWRLWLSVYQVFEEKIFDVLSPDFQAKEGLKLRESPEKGAYVEDLCILRLKTLEDGMTALNDLSSIVSAEDHSSTLIYTFLLEKVRTEVTASISGLRTEKKKKILQSARLHIVDVAPPSRLQGNSNPIAALMKSPNQDKTHNVLLQVLEKVRERQQKEALEKQFSTTSSASSAPSNVLVLDGDGRGIEMPIESALSTASIRKNGEGDRQKQQQKKKDQKKAMADELPKPPLDLSKRERDRDGRIQNKASTSTVGASEFIPFRTCTLTRLLQTSMDQWSNRVIVGHLSPADSSFKEDTLMLRALARVRGEQEGGQPRRELTPVPLPSEMRQPKSGLPRSDETPTLGGGFRWTYSKGGVGAGPKDV